ncbi:hypothetical protein [Paenibacillus tianmuensis]|uniref:hypothetical protein n=1 Tax=Paenibacillus tianmuensis TaxID=624147 RepID=UPI001C27235F|nr:hypothetical protein [Paenibacillus tianmuensis]
MIRDIEVPLLIVLIIVIYRIIVHAKKHEKLNLHDHGTDILINWSAYPDELKLVYGAFYSPPVELKQDIEVKYGMGNAERNQVLERLFEAVPLREGVDRKQAFELIMVTDPIWNCGVKERGK